MKYQWNFHNSYWASRLHRGEECTGRWVKVQTHRKERREARRLIDAEDYDMLRTHAAGGINQR